MYPKEFRVDLWHDCLALRALPWKPNNSLTIKLACERSANTIRIDHPVTCGRIQIGLRMTSRLTAADILSEKYKTKVSENSVDSVSYDLVFI